MSEYSGTTAHMSSDELRAWTSFLDAGRIIETEASRQLVNEHGMTHREYEVLVRVDGAGGRQRMSVLASQIEASAPLITQTVARLETRGWVDRQSSDDDGRGVYAQLTDEGERALRDAAGPHARLIQQLLTERLGADLDVVARALGAVADHLRMHRAGQMCDDPSCPVDER